MSTSSATRTTPTAADIMQPPALATTNHGGTPRTRARARQDQPAPTGRQGGSMSTILIGRYQATIYPEGNGYTGAISLGFDGRGNRQRIKRKARTQAVVKDKLKQAVEDRETASSPPARYTVADAVRDWLAKGLKGRDQDTITTNRILAEQHRPPADRGHQAQGADRRRRRRVARRAHRQARDPEPARSARDPQAGHPAGAGPRQSAPQRGRTRHHTQGKGGTP